MIHNEERLTESNIIRLVYGLLCSLKFLQTANVLHRDIKPANILVDESWNVRICDFGFARTDPFSSDPKTPTDKKELATILRGERETRQSRTRALSPHVITRWYRPPEVILLEKKYTSAVDLWSAGCTIAEVLNSSPPYLNAGFNKDKKSLFRGEACYPLSPAVA
mmetsp:Transcript_6221/g.10121  ORF Transcript_6221/g.10121 Transcript_6221/m.10121 type:complete len:165 (+) Transcript_6221:474-968(+)